MSSATPRTLFFLCIAISANLVANDLPPIYKEAKDYAAGQPKLRERSKAVSLLLQAKTEIPDPMIKAEIDHKLGLLYWQQFDPSKESRDLNKAIEYLQIALTEVGETKSLFVTTLKMHLGSCLSSAGRQEDSNQLLLDAIFTQPNEIMSYEIPDSVKEYVRKSVELKLSKRGNPSPDIYEAEFQRRISVLSDNAKFRLSIIQLSALQILLRNKLRQGEIASLSELADRIADPALKAVVTQFIAEHSSPL